MCCAEGAHIKLFEVQAVGLQTLNMLFGHQQIIQSLIQLLHYVKFIFFLTNSDNGQNNKLHCFCVLLHFCCSLKKRQTTNQQNEAFKQLVPKQAMQAETRQLVYDMNTKEIFSTYGEILYEMMSYFSLIYLLSCIAYFPWFSVFLTNKYNFLGCLFEIHISDFLIFFAMFN